MDNRLLTFEEGSALLRKGWWKVELSYWHETRMAELEYPEAVQSGLRQARLRWLAGARDD